jgi:regulator of cell morphogenesis and NO signaling
MSTMIDTSLTVGQLVAENPARARVFERVGIDYCCGGKKPLEEACRELGLDARTLAAILDTDSAPSGDRFADASGMTLTQLADHIEATHHAYLRRELPRIGQLLARVVNAHGKRHPAVIEVADVYTHFVGELQQHMQKEEQILFPAVRQLEAGATGGFHCGTLSSPIDVMEAEHDAAGEALARFRSLTAGYSSPEDVCNTYRALMDALRDLEEDMHQHVHKENNILFPRTLELEARCAAKA